jgi:3-polyprenyl-4-hydroxybenzoate decarboxylase
MQKNILSSEQSKHVCEYYRSWIQSAMEPILFEEISGVDWQVLIGAFLQDQLERMHQMNETATIHYIIEHKPSDRVTDLLKGKIKDEDAEDRRAGGDRRDTERRSGI